MVNAHSIQRIYRVSALIVGAAWAFYLFFQLNKVEPFRAVNPFGDDPYDAVGSIAIQAALLIGILSYARALRLQSDETQYLKARLILHGHVLVLAAIWITLLADGLATIIGPISTSVWGDVLRVELAAMFGLALIGTGAVVFVFWRVPLAAAPRDLTPADGIDDLWTLVRVPISRLRSFLPQGLVEWVMRFNSDGLFARFSAVNPRLHPWRFACWLGLVVGAGLVVAELQEGLPPSLAIGLLVAGIFISIELSATLIGFAILGGYLGLRPTLFNHAHLS